MNWCDKIVSAIWHGRANLSLFPAGYDLARKYSVGRGGWKTVLGTKDSVTKSNVHNYKVSLCQFKHVHTNTTTDKNNNQDGRIQFVLSTCSSSRIIWVTWYTPKSIESFRDRILCTSARLRSLSKSCNSQTNALLHRVLEDGTTARTHNIEELFNVMDKDLLLVSRLSLQVLYYPR